MLESLFVYFPHARGVIVGASEDFSLPVRALRCWHRMLLLRPTAALLLSCRWHAHPSQPRQTARRLSPLRLAASKGGDDDALDALVAGLNAQLNDWSDFEEAAAPPPAPTPGAGVSSKRAASGKSKAAKTYLRLGPKRQDPLTRLEKKRAKASGSSGASSGSDARPAPVAGPEAEAVAQARTSSAAAGEAGWAAVGEISGATQQAGMARVPILQPFVNSPLRLACSPMCAACSPMCPSL